MGTVFPIAGGEGGAMYKREAGTHHPQSNLELEGKTTSSIRFGNRRHRRRCWELDNLEQLWQRVWPPFLEQISLRGPPRRRSWTTAPRSAIIIKRSKSCGDQL